MRSNRKVVLGILMAVGIFTGVTLVGCARLEKGSVEDLNRDEKNAISAIEWEKNAGNLTQMEADIEKDAASRHSGLTF